MVERDEAATGASRGRLHATTGLPPTGIHCVDQERKSILDVMRLKNSA
jgi:hypothetical protein